MGIGSGINCLMLAVDWQRTLTSKHDAELRPHFKARPSANVPTST
jgi:hypothetical protein